MGDSAGGQIALSFAQYQKETPLPQPGHIVMLFQFLMQHLAILKLRNMKNRSYVRN